MQKAKKSPFELHREALLKGSRAAIKNLIKERRKSDDYLIISLKGNVVKVKARSLK